MAIEVLSESARELFKPSQCGRYILCGLCWMSTRVKERPFLMSLEVCRFFIYLISCLFPFFWWINADLGLYFGVGRLTQLIALTGLSGSWKKTIIDKSISSVNLPLPQLFVNNSISNYGL